MKNNNQSTLSDKVRQLRLDKGFSQELLAQHAQLNLRTVQRIENGESIPTGHSLNQLAAALGVTGEELTEQGLKPNKGIIAFLSLSAMSFMLFPLLGFIVPMVIWLLKKEEIKDMHETGRRLINFQISWCIYLVIGVIIGLKISTYSYRDSDGVLTGDPIFFIEVFYLLYAINFIIILFNLLRSVSGKKVVYQPAIPFIR